MKLTVTVLDGQGMPKKIVIEVPDDATAAEIQKEIEKAERSA